MVMKWEGIFLASMQDDLFGVIEDMSEEKAKELLNEIAVTLAGATQDKARHHDKIAGIFIRITEQ